MAGGHKSTPTGVEGVAAILKDKQRQIDALRAGMRVGPESITIVQLAPEVRPNYVEVTNLYTDPKPTNPANWLGGSSSGGGGIFNPTIVADSTYADLGLHLKFTSSSIGTGIGCSFSPNGSGLTADPSVTGVYGIGTTAKVLPFTDNLSYSFKFYASVGAPTFTPRLKFFDAAGSVVSVGDLGTSTGVVTFPAGTNGTYRGYLDYDAIIASAPTVASVLTTITVNTAGNGQAVYLGSAMGNFGTELMPYRDDDSTGWVTNEDGTSTGRINLDTIVSWQDLVGTQPPPPAHTHVAADITDFNTAVRTNRLDQMAAPTADVAFGSRKITGLADGTSAQHAATKNQVDTSTVQLTATHLPADNTAMIGLTAKKGDVAKKADNGKTYILTVLPASTLGNWLEIGGGGGAVNLIPTGAWDVGTTYAANDCVSLNGTSYVAIAATTGDDPETSPTFWQVLAEKGDTGAAGGITSVVAGTNVTIDNTDPDNPIINATGGGGAGGVSVDEGYPPLSDANNVVASTFATVGSAFVCDRNCTITRMAVNHKPTSGRTYRFAIWNYSTGTNTLGSEVGHVDTVAATTSTSLVLMPSDAVTFTLTAGTTYLLTITDVTGNNVGLGYAPGTHSNVGFMGHCPGVDGWVRTATNPLVSGTVMSDAGSYSIGWRLLGELT